LRPYDQNQKKLEEKIYVKLKAIM